MPRAKKTTTIKTPKKTTRAKISNTKVSDLKSTQKEILTEEKATTPKSNKFRSFITKKRVIGILALILLLTLAYANKKYFVAATVNNQPITTLELNRSLHKIYGERLLNQMTNKKILEQEAAKNGVVVTQAQINQKVAEVEQQNGGKEVFDSLLASEGLSRGEFEMQVSIQLLVKELYEKEASPSADEIQGFINENSEAPEATEPAKFQQIAIDQLTQQKLQTLVGEKFQQLKQNAKIQIF